METVAPEVVSMNLKATGFNGSFDLRPEAIDKVRILLNKAEGRIYKFKQANNCRRVKEQRKFFISYPGFNGFFVIGPQSYDKFLDIIVKEHNQIGAIRRKALGK